MSMRDRIVGTTVAVAAGGVLLIPGCAGPDPAPPPDDGCSTLEALRSPELPPGAVVSIPSPAASPTAIPEMSAVSARLFQQTPEERDLARALGPKAAAATVCGTTLEEAAAITGVSNDSLQGKSYNALWAQLNDRYAVFAQRLPEGKTWEVLGRELGGGIGREMSDHDLFDRMVALLQQLDDGHTSIEAPDLDRHGDSRVTEYEFSDEMELLRGNVESEYLDDDGMRMLVHGNITFGRIPDPDGQGDIGYINFSGASGLTNADEEPEDQLAAREAMQLIMRELGDVSGMIVDVRSNGGGWDEVAKEIASFFQGPETHAWTKYGRDGLSFVELHEENVAASPPDAYAGPTVVLTNPESFSAGDLFALAMRPRDNVALVGEPTTGHWSDVVGADAEFPTSEPTDGMLPNGFTFSFSGELYIGFDGTTEAMGVQPDHRVPFDPDAFEQGVDNQLEAAMRVLRGGSGEA